MTDQNLLDFYSENTINKCKIEILDIYFGKALPRMIRYLEIFNRHKNRKGVVNQYLAKAAGKRFKEERKYWDEKLSEWFPGYKPGEEKMKL